MTTITDPIARLAALRPSNADLDAAWPADRRAATLRTILEDNDRADGGVIRPLTPRQRPVVTRRRVLVAGGAVAAAVAAALIVPAVLPSNSPMGPASAAALERLATTAAAEPALLAGQYRHTVTTNNQNGSVTTQEAWTSSDGTVLRKDTAGSSVSYFAFPPGSDETSYPSPAFLASLPTDPADLADYLRGHVHGSTSTDEAVFTAVGDMLRGGMAPPALRAAALLALRQTGHVTVVDGHDSTGRSAVQVSFADDAHRPGEVKTLSFDPSSSRLLQEHFTYPGMNFVRTVTVNEVVDNVPATVRNNAVRQGVMACTTADDHPRGITCQAVAPETGGVAAPITSGR